MLLSLVACKHGGEEEDGDKPTAATVTCAPVESGDVADVVELSGVVQPPPNLDAIASSPIAGRIAQLLVQEGDTVAAGALIAVIEDPALPAGTIEAKAAVAAAVANKTAADQDVARQERLVNSGIGARKDLDDAKARAAAAAAELDAAHARSGLANSQLSRREIRAPRAGVVLHIHRRVGETVDGAGGTPIAEIADVAKLELHAQATPAVLAKLRDGMHATVHVLGIDTPIDASITRVPPAVDPVTLLGVVRLGLATSDGLKVGTSASAQVTVAARPGYRVPSTALRRSMVGDDEVVACVQGAVHVKRVKVGERTDKTVAILEGLAAGDKVVVDHPLGLVEGQALVEHK